MYKYCLSRLINSGLLIAIFVVWTAISCNCDPVNNDNLKSVLVFFRHGDRSPKESYPNDPYFNISYWPMGFGQLTNYGIQRQYNLGKWLRDRYNSFLTERYFHQDVYVYSTNVDRTLISASSALAGLFPPKNHQIWNPNLLWLPIPVHTAPEQLDEIVTVERKCPEYTRLLKEVKESNYFQEVNRNFSDLFKFISNHTGFQVEDIEKAKMLHCNLFLNLENYNKSLAPAWASGLEKPLEYLAGLAFKRDSFSEKMKRFQIGPFFHNLITNFEKKINNTDNTPKFWLISAHDTTLIAALNAMNLYDITPPPFSSAIIWELRTKADGTPYINIFYKRKALEKLTLEGCNFDCDFNTFKNILKPFTIDINTWKKECNEV